MNRIRNATKSLLSVIKPQAGYYVEFLIGLVLIAQGIAEGWPGQQLPDQHSFIFLSSETAEHLLAVWQFVSGLLMVVGISRLGGRWSRQMRRIGSFGAFLALSFVTFLGVISKEGNQIYWIATMGLALMSGMVHIRAGWKDE